MTEKKSGGKRQGQKYKSLLVWQYLLKRADEEHAVKMEDIISHLNAYGITVDRHSISRDIHDLQELFCHDQEAEIEEREQLNYEITYDGSKRGYTMRRPYDFEELRLLAECINGAKFLTQGQAKHLKQLVGELCSEKQSKRLQNEVYLIGRVNTANKFVMSSILAVSEAIKRKCKISFTYLKYTLQDRETQTARRRGMAYILNPFYMVVNDGNYYLLAYDEKRKDIRTFRIDRMKDVQLLPESRVGEDVFAKVDMRTYCKRVFSMFSGQEQRVSIRFTNDMLDTVVDRFGAGGEVFYRPDDKTHFIVNADVEISNQFYGWICGFRKRAKIVSPPEVVEGFQNFLKDIQERYQCEE